MLFGAVFVEGEDSYRDNFDRVQQKFDLVTDIYMEKARNIGNRAVMGTNCQSAGIVAQGLESIRRLFMKDIEQVDPEEVYRKVKITIEQNKDPGVGCPEVF